MGWYLTPWFPMILAVDVGSSSARASAYDESGRALDDLFEDTIPPA
jgi:ribulose kinase